MIFQSCIVVSCSGGWMGPEAAVAWPQIAPQHGVPTLRVLGYTCIVYDVQFIQQKVQC